MPTPYRFRPPRNFSVPQAILPAAPAIAEGYTHGATYRDIKDAYHITELSITFILRQYNVQSRKRGGDNGKSWTMKKPAVIHCKHLNRRCVVSDLGVCDACRESYATPNTAQSGAEDPYLC